jgi:hypothetical protein
LTAGTYTPSAHELECYHFLIDGQGKIHNGIFKPEDNLNCNDGKYAKHTGGGNTDSIGISLCGMANFKSKNDVGRFPITRIQFETAMQLCAKLSTKYNIPIKSDSICTHYEFGITHPETSSAGKIDIVYLPPFPNIKKQDIGDFIRSKIKWYFEKLQ